MRVSGEKMGLTMNVLLSIVVFLLLVSKKLPPTSSSVPLVAKYLLLTFILNVITIVDTVIVCNIFFRSPITHRIPGWVRTVFLDVSSIPELVQKFQFLPIFLCMQRPPREDDIVRRQLRQTRRSKGLPSQNSQDLPLTGHHPHCKSHENHR